MQRYKIKIEYDGTPFVGWQFQLNGSSIQKVLQDSIFALLQEKVLVTGAGVAQCSRGLDLTSASLPYAPLVSACLVSIVTEYLQR